MEKERTTTITVESRLKTGKHKDRQFQITYDGTGWKTYELSKVTDDYTGEVTTKPQYRERQAMVRMGVLKNQDYEAARIQWRGEHKNWDERVGPVENAQCPSCKSPIERYTHFFDNDAKQRREAYDLNICTACGKKYKIDDTNRSIPYNELPPPEATDSSEK